VVLICDSPCILNVGHLCGGNQCWVGTRYPTLARKKWTTIGSNTLGEPYFISLKNLTRGIEIETFEFILFYFLLELRLNP